MGEDPYIKALIKEAHSGVNERFLDRLLIASVAETRGAERFKLVSEHLDSGELKSFTKCFGLQKLNTDTYMLKWHCTIFLKPRCILD